jgi:hypothetical protein
MRTFESHRSQYQAEMAVCSDRECRDGQISRCWQKIYADVEHDATRLRSAAVEEKIVPRLLRLGRLMRERFWGFTIAERLPVEDIYTAGPCGCSSIPAPAMKRSCDFA